MVLIIRLFELSPFEKTSELARFLICDGKQLEVCCTGDMARVTRLGPVLFVMICLVQQR